MSSDGPSAQPVAVSSADEVKQSKEVATYARTTIEDLYGVRLDSQARSFYVTLQFLAVVWGVVEGPKELFDDWTQGENGKAGRLTFKRRSHDFARRLLNGDDSEPMKKRRATLSEDPITLNVLAEIFKALVVEFPYAKPHADATKFHFEPYLGQLVHKDFATIREVDQKAMKKRDEDPAATDFFRYERVYYRGGGTLVYEIFRADLDEARRNRIKAKLEKLVEESADDVLGQVTNLANECDAIQSDIWLDRDLEPDLIKDDEKQHWLEIMRDGTDRILSVDSPGPREVGYLMYWLPFCLAHHFVWLAYRELGRQAPAVPVDMGAGNQLRRKSQTSFNNDKNNVRRAIIRRAEKDQSGEEAARLLATETFPRTKQSNPETTLGSMGQFVRATYADVGAINANSGSGRHYTLKLDLLEAIVHATVDHDDPRDLEDFCFDILYKQLGMIVDQGSGQDANVTMSIDSEDLEKNNEGLTDRLGALGLITAFSDQTLKVGPSR